MNPTVSEIEQSGSASQDDDDDDDSELTFAPPRKSRLSASSATLSAIRQKPAQTAEKHVCTPKKLGSK